MRSLHNSLTRGLDNATRYMPADASVCGLSIKITLAESGSQPGFTQQPPSISCVNCAGTAVAVGIGVSVTVGARVKVDAAVACLVGVSVGRARVACGAMVARGTVMGAPSVGVGAGAAQPDMHKRMRQSKKD